MAMIAKQTIKGFHFYLLKVEFTIKLRFTDCVTLTETNQSAILIFTASIRKMMYLMTIHYRDLRLAHVVASFPEGSTGVKDESPLVHEVFYISYFQDGSENCDLIEHTVKCL